MKLFKEMCMNAVMNYESIFERYGGFFTEATTSDGKFTQSLAKYLVD